ncbi:1,3-beta-glucanosyltransferase gel1 [Aspergillus udagawae]|uniref:1,3-beta-glucanosyltransferase n=1 Tax=Aspergillus udagawae TaxID=91492 RepID=A0A8H3RUS5_9EURO|nr:beta-glucanosyltransferase [Aspergillus udagawae]GFF32749.1 1,3-beta-glucanosyltransferase gel1 [Aspergillus udagawae]GFF33090.1 1,3-beta-glucanosyltransferase gel1 [Aspergillus udagawae]GFF75670.1 1,3-beta-glucanosyltransferase gel1 [Aspergillus udagawae]GFG01765.1 1,3-beta-glucanosyltransferase gel1 [Aspergillus udagawae]GFG27687.1 1,3-beta-glucanosyltransferase gel1 [Aspergillus udagawae]
MKASAVAAALAVGASNVLAAPSIQARDDITPITVKGNAFFKGDDRFYIRGVDYQPGGSSDLADPIADANGCKRDIAKFKELGLNTIRVYSVDNSKNHDECMNALADAGIYLVLDVNTPKYSINRSKPKESYNDVYLQYIFATVDAFAGYKNTLAFFSGNEVINDGPSSSAAPYVKAVTRDLRQYIRSRNYRSIPVGYSAADIDTNRLQMAQYMNCGSDDERSDFFAFNDYSWCDPSSFTTSGWDQKVKNFTGYGLPLFLSEYGCNTNKRQFQEVGSLYNTDMTGVYSGGLVYEYSQEASNYGLVEISGNNVKELSDFDALKTAFQKTSNPSGDGNYNKTGGANPCPAKDSPNWDVDNDVLPAIPEPAKKYMTEGAGKGPGFGGSGSQDRGTQSTATAAPGSGSSTGSSSSGTSTSSKGAAAGLTVPSLTMAPVVVGAVSLLSTVFGAGLVLL